ncbi:MAG: COX15/CtaA family protein [Acidimicrobiales bacterium]|nr:COX15/CtaA family protein [Acidimicrobiales bacterium]
MRIINLNARQYHLLTQVALWLLAAIVVSGAAVRLSGSGLGCSDWPNCEPGLLVPEADFHAWVEFGNRLVTGLVSIAVVLAVLGSLRRVPTSVSLTKWSLGLVAGVAAQIALGAVTVLTHLSPPVVMGHFLLSMVLIWNSVVLEDIARPERTVSDRPSLPKALRSHARAVGVGAAVVIITGTIVTASGPHGGDEHVVRLDFSFPDVARIHGSAVVLLVVLVLSLFLRTRHTQKGLFKRRVTVVLITTLGQAAIGYTQYFTQLPVLLVGCHIAGATLLWMATIRLLLASSERPSKAV